MKAPAAAMKKRSLLIFVLGLVCGGGVVAFLLRPSAPQATRAMVPDASPPAPDLSADNANPGGGNYDNSAGNGQNQPKVPRPAPDPQARAALALVGTDPAAEQYWLATINNPEVSNKERKDLIEDLADTGFTNIRNPTVADLQLVAYRLQLLQQLAQNPMDQTNAKALAEAQKDLTKTATRALSQAP
jgi:hypothetical protein